MYRFFRHTILVMIVVTLIFYFSELPGKTQENNRGYRSCFYRSIPVGEKAITSQEGVSLQFTETEKTFDPQVVYGDVPNPTQL